MHYLKAITSAALMYLACSFAGAADDRQATRSNASAPTDQPNQEHGHLWQNALDRGRIYSECGTGARQLLRGWLDLKQDQKTHLFSRDAVWNYHNEAADHYSSLVLIANYVAPEQIEPGAPLHQTLGAMSQLCRTPTCLLSLYDLRSGTPGKAATYPELAEWLRDGLTRINEIRGTTTDWYGETERLVDAMLAEASGLGGLHKALRNNEARGNMLQTLARLYIMSGRETYLAAAEVLGDAVLLNGKTATSELLVFKDHGGELIPGLGELFAVECQLRRPRALSYKEPLRQLLDSVMADGAHPLTGLFANYQPGAGKERTWQQPPDTWGYVLFAYENFDRATGETYYRAKIERPLRWLMHNRDHYHDLADTLWPRSRSNDDWSDSYESMIVLWNRYHQVGDGFAWLDWATKQSDHRRQRHPTYGPYVGGHTDGSLGRTLCMHMMLCSQGVRAMPFADSVELGAVQDNGCLLLSLHSREHWKGTLVFDGPRTRCVGGELDWARINEMPQWFVVRPDARYQIRIDDADLNDFSGKSLIEGVPLSVEPGKIFRIWVKELALDDTP